MAQKAIVMDFFGVICSEVAPFWLAEHFSPEHARAIKAGLIDDADRGKVTAEVVLAELSTLCGVPAADIESRWRTYARVDSRFAGLLQRWRAEGRRVGLLTNAQSAFVRSLLAENRLELLFDAIVVSSEIGCAKPDRLIYDTMLSALGVPAGDAVMVDDNPVNIEGAVAAGMTGVLFTSFEELCRLMDSPSI